MKNIISFPLVIQCLFMETKINYYLISEEEIKKVDLLKKKPTLLLHTCCGPCSTFPLTYLCPHFNVTIFFNNSNIYPSQEYERRLDELRKFLILFEKDYGYKVNLIVRPYDNEKYNESLEPYKDIPEGGLRCFICYEKRMDEAYNYASKNGYDYFTTVMSVSRQKNSQKINEIGQKLSLKYPNTKYFYSDFKKNDGGLKARNMRIHYNLYQQLYCGCKYSYEKRIEFDKGKKNV